MKILFPITIILFISSFLASCNNEKDYDCLYEIKEENYPTWSQTRVYKDCSKSEIEDIETQFTRKILDEETKEVISTITMTCEESKF